MKPQPPHEVIEPREELREGKSQDASEFAVHLDHVRDRTARGGCKSPEQLFDKTFPASKVLDLAVEPVRRLSDRPMPVSAGLMLLAVLCFGCHTSRVASESMTVPNCDRVDGVLWRGGQPRQAGIKWLKGVGVALVVNLRNDPLPGEAAWCRELGIGYTNLPMNGYGLVEAEQVAKFVAIYEEKKASGEKVFVHCRHGCDRTGTAVAAVRIVNGWTNADALGEAQTYGLAWWLPGYTKFIRGYRPIANSQ